MSGRAARSQAASVRDNAEEEVVMRASHALAVAAAISVLATAGPARGRSRPGKKRRYSAGPPDVPLRPIVVLGAQPAADAGACGEAPFNPSECAVSRSGKHIVCRRRNGAD